MSFPQYDWTSHWFVKCIFILYFLIFCYTGNGQCRKAVELGEELRTIEGNAQWSTESRITRVVQLKKEFEKCKFPADSVYARILHRIALYEYIINNNTPTTRSIDYTLESIKINTANTKGSSGSFAVNSYCNLAKFYRDLKLYHKALQYYDSTMLLVNKFPGQHRFTVSSRFDRSDIFFHTGNYQQSIDESLSGFLESKKVSDTSWMISFLNQMAQSQYSQDQLFEAIEAADKAIGLANMQKEKIEKRKHSAVKFICFELATAFKTKALVYQELRKDSLAELFFRWTIKNRIASVKDNDYGQVAGDYNDFGNFYLTSVKSIDKANACYRATLEFARKTNDKERIAKALLNLGQSFYRQHNYKLAEDYYDKSLHHITSMADTGFLQQPTSVHLDLIVNKEYTLVYLRNRLELLIRKFRNTNDTNYLTFALRTAYLTDTIITQIRHEQAGEQSKLYWRRFTNESYSFAMEAAYLSKDPADAFFFMEKSRAVLLNDKLNELGSFAYLPTNEALKEQQLRNDLLQQQQSIALSQHTDKNDEASQLKFLHAKENFSRYIKSLEKNYPSYYQYKYADAVPSLGDLKAYLAYNLQSFVHYFIGDSATYVLGISGNNIRMLRIGNDQFKFKQVTELLRICSDKQRQNNEYSTLASLSYKLNKTLFEPLRLPKGRVVICLDNFLLPFEALSADATGSRMLVNDYAFTYIYSARYLLKEFPEYPSKGNFAGFAPVSFRSSLRLTDLNKSAVSLSDVADNYSSVVEYKKTKASKRNFLATMGNYHIVNIFSHARADESDSEPVLFMQDSVIGLSELQHLSRPCTKLVVLSACQTTAGKSAAGEGIYSLARGFAAAGIPSVAATIWKADEEAVYSISRLFHRYLSQGMRKDEALQKAKLVYIQNSGREQLLPYYWANMIIVGNPASIKMNESSPGIWWILAPAAIIFFLLILAYRSKHQNTE